MTHTPKHMGGSRRNHKGGAVIKGGDASQFAIDVYGDMGKQHAVSDTDHTIAMNKMAGGASHLTPAAVVGGASHLTPAVVVGGASHLTPAVVVGGASPLTPALLTPALVVEGSQKHGGNMLSTIAVPAGLLLVNNMYKGNRIGKIGKSMRKGMSKSMSKFRKSVSFSRKRGGKKHGGKSHRR